MNIANTFIAAAATALATSAAVAAPPANIAGTTWTLQANRDSIQLVVVSQSGAGAPGAATCRVINGSIGIAPVRGWYCPPTGRIHFVHQNLDSHTAMRVFSGNVSDEVIGQPLYMGGVMSVLAVAFGDYGEFNFSGRQ